MRRCRIALTKSTPRLEAALVKYTPSILQKIPLCKDWTTLCIYSPLQITSTAVSPIITSENKQEEINEGNRKRCIAVSNLSLFSNTGWYRFCFVTSEHGLANFSVERPRFRLVLCFIFTMAQRNHHWLLLVAQQSELSTQRKGTDNSKCTKLGKFKFSNTAKQRVAINMILRHAESKSCLYFGWTQLFQGVLAAFFVQSHNFP